MTQKLSWYFSWKALGDDLLKPVTECLTALPFLSLEALAILVLVNSW